MTYFSDPAIVFKTFLNMFKTVGVIILQRSFKWKCIFVLIRYIYINYMLD